jgi:hypothetical protein
MGTSKWKKPPTINAVVAGGICLRFWTTAHCAVGVRMLLVGNDPLRAFVPLCEPKSMKGSHKATTARRPTKARHAEPVSASYFGRINIKTLKKVQGDDAALVG